MWQGQHRLPWPYMALLGVLLLQIGKDPTKDTQFKGQSAL